MSDPAADLAELGRYRLPIRVRSVTAVNNDGSVDLDFGRDADGDTSIVRAPCMDGYHTRSPGDRVVVFLTDEIGWFVLGRVGAEALITSQLKITQGGTNA